MTVEVVERFTALLALLINGATVGVVVLRFRARTRPSSMLAIVGQFKLWIAGVVATAATVGSLYFSEVANYRPCTFCWYQRIAMYPLALILGIAAVRKDRSVVVYAVPLAAIGALISLYHVLLERYPQLESSSCDPEVPCNVSWFREFGFVTLAHMALSAFIFIIVTLRVRDAGQDSVTRADGVGE